MLTRRANSYLLTSAVLTFLFAFRAGSAWGQATSAYKDLHDFGGTVVNADGVSGPDGYLTRAGITFDSNGNMYGTTSEGGPNGGLLGYGMVWEITKSGQYKDLHDFGGTVTIANGSSGPDGISPTGSIVFDSVGNMYGAASLAGGIQLEGGMVWEITSTGQYKDLHDFGGTTIDANGASGPDGDYPTGVAFDSAGNMYGTAGATAIPNGATIGGMVWEITASGIYKDRHDFGGTVTNANGTSGPDGVDPEPAILDSQGDMFGTTGQGGANTNGMVWEITASGTYKDLHDFGGVIINADGASGPDGYFPQAGPTLDGAGNLYGTASGGPSSNNLGSMVWEIVGASQAPVPIISPAGGTFAGAQPVTISDPNNAASIYYTTNGLTPTSSSALYTGTITVSSGETVKAIAIAPGYANSAAASAAFTILPLTIGSLVISPTSIIGGASSSATVKLSGTVAVDTAVTVTSSSAKATLTSPVTVPAGQDSATLTIDTSSVAAPTSATIKAAVGTSSKSALLSIKPLTLTSLTLSPTSVIGGATWMGTIKLNGPAPTDTSITVTSSNGAATLTSPVTIPAGQSSATVTFNTLPVTALTSATIKATLGTMARSAILSINPLMLTSVTLLPTSVIGGNSSTATLKLNGAAPSDASVIVTSSSGAATVSSPVTVPAGQSSATFTVSTIPVAVNTIATIKATLGTSTKSSALTVKAPTITSFSVNPTSVVGGAATSTLTIDLSGNAPAAGLPIKLASNLPAVLAVTNTTVPGGANTVQVTLSPHAITAQRTITITGMLNGVSKTAVLTVTP